MTAVCGFKSNNRRIGSNQDLTTESGDSGLRPRAWDRDKTGKRKVLNKEEQRMEAKKNIWLSVVEKKRNQ